MIILAQNLLFAVKTAKPYYTFLEDLANTKLEDLLNDLQNDDQKICFWVNIYNAFIQIMMQTHSHLSKKDFFTTQLIQIAGQSLSFDEIEHGILRHSQLKYGLGFITHPFPSALEKKMRVKKRDYRIHFALNCGAVSCPPIAFYKLEILDKQMEIATRNYLESTTIIDKEKNIVYISRLFLWFRGDFGGKKGILYILKKYQLIPEDIFPKLRYNTYDWLVKLGNYVEF